MNKQPLKPWELALAAGLIIGMLATPARAQGTVLSRWPAQSISNAQEYRVSLFPFAVGHGEQQTLAPEAPEAEPTYEVKFKLVEWVEKLKDAINP